MAALGTIDLELEAEEYEFRADEGDHTPTDAEKALLIDFGAGLMHAVHDAIRPLMASAPTAPKSDLAMLLARQMVWSRETFGPAPRTKGIIQHITKELREIEADPHDLIEWVDVIILAMDGFHRHGGKPQDLPRLLKEKQLKNTRRRWPDWRKVAEDQPIEHTREGDDDARAAA
ncbi:dATP/dGTP pyrophosphohydrolase domain-containing protein [Methylobacterium sp. Leaf85]|uniref:dATP/dGTP pyrophosphohydrolase domain-containing protein n=1 Tax=Methylobacterium sp. Leaf85 TaxID=1736241 RepID=UPI001FCDB600|nr:dATP/dGTP pyrophosphohydrolase domain-containing protein [Methylobacterium sp. Leaf85]